MWSRKRKPPSWARVRRRILEMQAEAEREAAKRIPDSIWDNVTDRNGWTAKQRAFRFTFEAFDQLPRAVRHALHEALVTYEPRPILQDLSRALENSPKANHRAIVRDAVRGIQAGDIADIQEVARKHFERYKYRWPHLAAGATILRYHTRTRLRGRRRSRPPATFRQSTGATRMSSSRLNLTPEDYPFTIVAIRSDTKAEVWRKEVLGPGLVYIPPLAERIGCRMEIEMRWPDGRVQRDRG